MTPRRKRRLSLLFVATALLSVSGWLVVDALREQVVYFYAPTELISRHIPLNKKVRIGGMVAPGTLKRLSSRLVAFTVTDGETTLNVRYSGLLPSLFREGSGVIGEGKRTSEKTFFAEKILAKHDENYIPRDVVETYKRPGLKKYNAFRANKGLKP